MFQHILVPTDGSTLSTDALRKATRFAKEAHARLVIVTVTRPPHIITPLGDQVDAVGDVYGADIRARAAQDLADAAAIPAAAGVPCDTVQIEHEQPYQAIIDTATNKGCDLIAMASHGRRGLAALLVGSETTKVLTHSKVPVLVYR